MTDDLIRRQDAIDAIEKLNIPEDMCVFEILSHIELAIGTLPSAQPERKTGQWIHHDDKAYAGGGYEECSCCKWRCSEWVFIEDSHYCPNCGARMDGEQNDIR